MSDRVGSIGGQTIPQQFNTSEADNNSKLSAEVKEIYEKNASLEKLEELQVPKSASGHRAKRILSGIFGGLMLAVGVAAATASVIVSCGASAGLIAAAAGVVGGVTGTSIISGCAGCLGLGLLAKSLHKSIDAPKQDNVSKFNEINNKVSKRRSMFCVTKGFTLVL